MIYIVCKLLNLVVNNVVILRLEKTEKSRILIFLMELSDKNIVQYKYFLLTSVKGR
jgi:hypothetical protein